MCNHTRTDTMTSLAADMTPSQRLTILVRAAPSTRPFPEHQDLRPWCPLRRASYAAGDAHSDLVDFGVSLGFTEAESYGLMRGFDLAIGIEPCFAHVAEAKPVDVARGESIAIELTRHLRGPAN
jgi:hypothetical protein